MLLEGITFPPERRSAMVQTMGPLTILISLWKSKPDHRQKFLDAAKRTFSNYEEIDSSLNAIIRSQSADEVKPLLRALADLALTVGTRNQHRAFFAPGMFVRRMVDDEVPGPVPDEGMALGVSRAQFICDCDFSGRGALLMWQQFSNYEYVIEGAFTPEQAQQLVFHSVWGTHVENLKLLEIITDCANFQTRGDFGSVFQGSQEGGKVTAKFKLINFKYYSKLGGANLTDYNAGGNEQLTHMPVFAGKRTRMLDANYFKGLEAGKTVNVLEPGITGLVNFHRRALMKYKAKMEKESGVQRIGTVEWRKAREYMNLREAPPVTLQDLKESKLWLGKEEL